MIALSQDQKKVINLLTDFVFDVNNTNTIFSLIGKPGVGKTTVIKEFLKILKSRKFFSYTLCAPTHKAANILSEGTDENVYTLHKYLSLSPKIDILKFDAKNLIFDFNSNFTGTKLLIVDEASMINDDLYDAIINRTQNAKIIFISDLKQLQPVKSKKLSKVSLISNKFELTTNHRQDDSILMDLIEESRFRIVSDFSEYKTDNLILYNSAKKMSDIAIENFQMQSALEYQKFCKILTFTNERVEKFNNYIHKAIADNAEYVYNEILTGYAGYKDIIRNSEDFLVKHIKKDMKFLNNANIAVEGFRLKIKSMLTGEEHNIFILDQLTDDKLKVLLAKKIDELRVKAITSKSREQSKKIWKQYYELEKSFCTPFDLIYDNRVIKPKTLDYGYAQTIHRAQGSTYDVVYYDNNSIQFCHNLEEKRQLQHVALSRVREQLNILIWYNYILKFQEKLLELS